MPGNAEWKIIGNYRQYRITDDGWRQTMVNGRQWEVTYHGEW